MIIRTRRVPEKHGTSLRIKPRVRLRINPQTERQIVAKILQMQVRMHMTAERTAAEEKSTGICAGQSWIRHGHWGRLRRGSLVFLCAQEGSGQKEGIFFASRLLPPVPGRLTAQRRTAYNGQMKKENFYGNV